MGCAVVVAGVVNVQQTIPVDGFPVPYGPVRYLNGSLRLEVAGVGANVARGLTALGRDVRLASFVGRDGAGRLVRDTLAREGLLGPGVLESTRTAQSAILVDPQGQRQITTDLRDLPGAVYPPEVFASLLDSAALAVVSTIGFARALLPVAAAVGVPIAVDLQAIRGLDDPYAQDWLTRASVVFCSAENLTVGPHAFTRELLARGPARIVVVALGARGALLATTDRPPRTVAAFAPRGVVDTTGAGDALFAGFLHAWLATGDPDQALDHAILVAGLTVGVPGTERYPTAAQIRALQGETTPPPRLSDAPAPAPGPATDPRGAPRA